MGVIDWSRNPDENGRADPSIPASDTVAARDIVRGQRGIMAAVKRLADDQGGALVSTGTADSFVVRSYSASSLLRSGLSLSFVPNRDNEGPASFNLDGLGPRPLLDRNGADLAAGALKSGRLARVVYDALQDAWRTTDIGVVSNVDLSPMAIGTIKGNDGSGVADLAVDAARALLQVDHLPNKTEAEMVSDGPISVAFANVATALAIKATPQDITDALAPVNLEIAKKATPADIDTKLVPVVSNVSTLQTSSATQAAQITALQTGQKSDRITRGAYADFSGMTLVADATYEVLDRDTGTHPGISSEDGYNPDTGRVPNAGIFIPKESPLVLRRIGGTSAGAVPGLVADNTTLRATRYVSRPGENPRGWTAAITAAPGTAAPIELGGTFATGVAAGGRSLRIAGASQAGPIAMVWIQPGVIYDLEILASRTIADAAENRVLPRIRAFGLDQVELSGSDGILALPAVTLAVGDPLTSIKTSISTVPGAAALTFPRTTGGYARAYLSTAGASNGEIAVSEMRLGPRVLSVLDSFKNALFDPVILDTDRIAKIDASGVVLSVSTASALAAYIEAKMAGPAQYTWPAHAVIGTENKVVIPDDPGIKEFGVYNRGPGRVHLAQGGVQSAVDGEGTIAINSLGSHGTSLVAPGAVSAIGESASKLTIFFRTTTSYNVAARAAAQSYIDRIVGRGVTLTTDQANSLRDLYAELYACGALSVLGGFYNFRGPAAAHYMNLCDIARGFADNNGEITRTSWRNAMFDGSTGWVDTRLKFAGIAAPNDFGLLAYPGDGTTQGSTRVAGGDGNITLTPSRTNTTVGIRALGGTFYSPAGFTAGAGLLSLSLTDPANAIVRQKKTTVVSVPVSGTGTTFSDRTILIGARNGGLTGGAASPAAGSYFLGPMMFFGVGRHLTDAMHNAISDACDKFVATTGAFS